MSFGKIVMNRVKPNVEPEQVDRACEVSRKVNMGFVIAMRMLQVVCTEQPMKAKTLRNQYEQDEFLPIQQGQHYPCARDQSYLKQ